MYLLLAVLLYAFAVKHSSSTAKIKATEQNTNYTAEGGASLRGDVPSVQISPAHEHHEEDISTPHVSHPDDVGRVHRALQLAKSRQQLDDPVFQSIVQHIQSTGATLGSWHE